MKYERLITFANFEPINHSPEIIIGSNQLMYLIIIITLGVIGYIVIFNFKKRKKLSAMFAIIFLVLAGFLIRIILLNELTVDEGQSGCPSTIDGIVC